MGTAHEARVPFVEIGPGLRGTPLATQVPFAGTAPCEYATDGVGARELETEEICAALLDRLAAGARASRETNGGVPYSAAGGRVASGAVTSSFWRFFTNEPVSYTHLTLPTIYSV